MGLIPASHDDARAREWFARLDPVIRKHRLRSLPHGMAVLVEALNDAGVHSSLLTRQIKTAVAGRRIPEVIDGEAYVLLVDGCLLHSHGCVGKRAWESAHLQAHRKFHAGIQPVITPFPDRSAHAKVPAAVRHAPSQPGFSAIKMCHTELIGLPAMVNSRTLYGPGGGKDPWPDRLREDISKALSGCVPAIKPSSGYHKRPAPRGLGDVCEQTSLKIDALSRHWMAYGKADAANLLWAVASLVNEEKPSARFWCRPITRLEADGRLHSTVAMAVSFSRGGRRHLAHFGDPSDWGVPEPTVVGGRRDPDYMAVHFDYINFSPSMEWIAACSSLGLATHTPIPVQGSSGKSPRF